MARSCNALHQQVFLSPNATIIDLTIVDDVNTFGDDRIVRTIDEYFDLRNNLTRRVENQIFIIDI